MPTKESIKQEELEQELKKHGKWDDVKQLNSNSLNKILLEHKRLFVSTKKS